jgi:glycerophosphoryl diester phosphodiesterase
MAWAARKKLAVNVWTVDDGREAERLAGLGVQGIITNKPEFIRSVLG